MAELARTAPTLSSWSHFGITLGHLGFILNSLWPKLAEVSANLTLSWPNMAPSSPKLGPRWLQIYTWGHFGSTLESLWVILGTLGDHFGVALSVFGTVLSDFGISLS